MENATTALLIAGGILFAILIVSMGMFACTSITSFQEEQATQKLNEEIAAFNEGFLAYNKTRLFGTDVISVVNKAIYNNKKFQSTSGEAYYVNIIIKTEDNFITTAVVKNNKNGQEATKDFKDLRSNIRTQLGDSYKQEIQVGETSLGTVGSSGQFMENKGVISLFNQDAKDQLIVDGNETYHIYSALTNFKTAIFKCESVQYDPKEGRITSMTFRQIK